MASPRQSSTRPRRHDRYHPYGHPAIPSGRSARENRQTYPTSRSGHFSSRLRRPSPVPDRRTSRRQRYVSPEPGGREDRRSQQDSQSTSSALPVPGPRSPQEGQRRERSESPSLFFPVGSPSHNSSGSSDGDENFAGTSFPVTDFTDEEDNDPTSCQCPVNLRCPRRADNLLDCRTLVLEWDSRRMEGIVDYERIDREVIPGLAEVVSEVRVRDFLRYHRIVEQRSSGSAETRKRNFLNMVRWAREIRIKSVTQAVLDITQILPQLQTFLNPVNPLEHYRKRTPINLIEDLEYLYRKWKRGDLLADANRGLRLVTQLTAEATLRTRLRIDDNWPHRMHDTFYGNGHLVNGQRWNSRIEMSRDGAHGPLVAGIAGSVKDGARSVVMGYHNDTTKDYYADVDQQDKIYYIGTALPKSADGSESATNVKDTVQSRNRYGQPTYHTQMLIKSIETQIPVRVFRSYKLATIVKHKPAEGYRYDGLYKVVRAKLLKKDRQIYRFTMKRLRPNDPASGGQGPLRGVQRRTA